VLGKLKRVFLDALPFSWGARLRLWKMHRSIRNYPQRVVEHSYGGGRLKVFLSDPLAQGWYDQDWPELPEIAALRQTRLKPGAKVFDLGAHQGIVALMLSRETGPTGLVLALEANPHNAAAARRNAELNQVPQMRVKHAAISNRSGTLVFNQGLNGNMDDGSGAWGRMEVPCTTIDDLAEELGLPDVVFLDVEGAECLALEGAQRVLAAGADFFVEVHVEWGLEKLGGSVERVFGFFDPARYQLRVRIETDENFRALAPNDPITRARFFLLATCTMPAD